MQINFLQVLLQIVNFAILVGVLTKFLYKPILKILESRAQKIQEGLEAAEKSLEEKARTEEARTKVLSEAEKEAADILDKARLEAKSAAKDIVAAARVEAQEAVAKEYQIVETKLKEEELKIRRNLADIVAKTTSTILQGALSDSAQRQIIKSQISKLWSLILTWLPRASCSI